MLVMRASTGEFWNGIMYDTTTNVDGCVSNPPYNASMCGFKESFTCTPINGCGTPIGYVYFLFFSWIVTFVFVNLFIAVILEGFEDSKAEDEDTSAQGLSVDEFNEFCCMWVKYDKEMDWFVTHDQLYKIIAQLTPPMGLGLTKVPPDAEMKKIIGKYGIMKRGGDTSKQPFHFEDVSQSMVRYVVSLRCPQSAGAAPAEVDPITGRQIVAGSNLVAVDSIPPGTHVKVLI